MPQWSVATWLFQATRITLLLVFFLDLFYYFGLRTTQALRHQVLSGLLLIPCLLVYGKQYLPSDTLLLTPPYYGKALIWTDRIVDPRTFYFMDPKSKPLRAGNKDFVDPNYGKAAFSPLNGQVVQVENGFISLRSPQTRVRVGPLLPSSIRLQPGDVVRSNQPLGLITSAGLIPGLSLTVESDQAIRFAETFTGRWWAGRYAQAVLKRNQMALADAKDRFQLRPIDQ